MANVLVIEDEAPLRQSVVIALKRDGYEVAEAESCSRAVDALAREPYDLLLLDLRLPDGDGLDVLREVRRQRVEAAVVVMSAYGTVESAVEAMRLGAFDFLQKPFVPERLRACALRALENSRLRAELRRRPSAVIAPGAAIVGMSPAMVEVRRLIKRAAQARVVLITGETGTGKDLVAGAVHACAGSEEPFVVVNCGALALTLVESELFGHLRGAFTGAEAARRGLFGEADGGSAFLDEIAELPLAAQAGLLRVLESGEYRPVGADHVRRVSCRVIAATNRDLAAEVESGRFRHDLYYRLDLFRIHLPPLRERPEDVEPLARHLLARICARMRVQQPDLTLAAVQALHAHPWPGNIRELEHALERAVLLAEGEPLVPELLILPDSRADQTALSAVAPEAGEPPSALATVERAHILRVLEQCGRDRTRSAAMLGISRSTLRRKLIEYGLWPPRRAG
jgi:two-component system response regulator AtoC